MFKMLNELIEIPINDRLIRADVVGIIMHINTIELTPHWDKIIFGIEPDCNSLPAAAIK